MPTMTFELGGRPINRMGFGAMQLPGPGVWGPPRDRDEAIAVLRRAVEGGVDHIDTAQYYGPDVANDLIRDALYPYPEGLRIVTKVGGRRGPNKEWLAAARPEEIRAGVEDNLRSLRLERMPLVNMRLIGQDDVEGPDVPLAESLGALADLRDEGKVELIGLSAATAAELEEARALVDIASLQNHFGILDREGAELVEVCRAEGIAFVPFFPLGSAFMGGPAKLAETPAIVEVAARHEATPAQVALAWLLHFAPNVLLIPGTSSLAHLEENLGAAELGLDAGDLEALGVGR